MKAQNIVSYCALVVAGLIALQGGNPPPVVKAYDAIEGTQRQVGDAFTAHLEPAPEQQVKILSPSEASEASEKFRREIYPNLPASRFAAEIAQAPATAEPLSIKISGPRHPTLGDRPVWFAEVRGDAGTPNWRVSPPTTGIVPRFNGQIIEWEPPFAGEFTIYVSVGGANKQAADDAYNITVHPLGQDPAPQPQQPIAPAPQQPPQEQGRMAAMPRDKAFWNGRVAELVSNVDSLNKIAEARAIAGVVLNLVLRVERDNYAGTEYTDDLYRGTINLVGPSKATPWKSFFAGLGRDLTLQDLRWIESALAHVVLAASRGSSGSTRIETAKET